MLSFLDLARLDKECFEHAWTELQIRDTLATQFAKTYVCTAPGEVVRIAVTEASSGAGPLAFALVLWGLETGTLEILRIGTLPAARRQGLARTLLATMERDAREDHLERLVLEVSSANSAALALYSHQGLIQLRRRRHYYPDGSDAVLMEKKLS